MKRLFIFILIPTLIGGAAIYALIKKTPAVSYGAKNKLISRVKQPSFSPTAAQYSTADPSNLWILVDKAHPLSPLTYTPVDLVVPTIPLRTNITNDEQQLAAPAAKALESLDAAAKQQGIIINLQSGYRSYSFQQNLYSYYVKTQGQNAANMYSAKPGYSEHQTGLAADLGDGSDSSCDIQECFSSTAAGVWLSANSYKFGFILRYSKGLESVTGYAYEPWHYRYVGSDLAQRMHASSTATLEQEFTK